MQNTAVSNTPPLFRSQSCPQLGPTRNARRASSDVFTRQAKSPTPLCSEKTWSRILKDCEKAKRKHDHFDLRGGMARGAAVAQLVGMGLTLSGLLGGWALAALGAGIITATVVFCLARYLIQRGGKAAAAERKADAIPLEMDLKVLKATLSDKQAVKEADKEDLKRAQDSQKRLEETIAMLRGGPWYVVKRLISSTVVGPIMAGLEMLGPAATHTAGAIKRSLGELRWSRPRSPHPRAQ